MGVARLSTRASTAGAALGRREEGSDDDAGAAKANTKRLERTNRLVAFLKCILDACLVILCLLKIGLSKIEFVEASEIDD